MLENDAVNLWDYLGLDFKWVWSKGEYLHKARMPFIPKKGYLKKIYVGGTAIQKIDEVAPDIECTGEGKCTLEIKNIPKYDVLFFVFRPKTDTQISQTKTNWHEHTELRLLSVRYNKTVGSMIKALLDAKKAKKKYPSNAECEKARTALMVKWSRSIQAYQKLVKGQLEGGSPFDHLFGMNKFYQFYNDPEYMDPTDASSSRPREIRDMMKKYSVDPDNDRKWSAPPKTQPRKAYKDVFKEGVMEYWKRRQRELRK